MSRGARWTLRVADPKDREALERLGTELSQQDAAVGEVREVAGKRVYLKGSHLRGSGARRHGLARWFAGRRVPRDAEYHHLMWLREHGFGAPAPLGAGVLWRGLLPRYQWLATELVEEARPLGKALDDPTVSRETLLATLAQDVARMHDLGFLHHDLFLRNLLVVEGDSAARIVFLDAWAGGFRRGLRGPAYDLACLLSDLHDRISPTEARALLDAYSAARTAGAISATAFADAVDRDLRGLARKLKRSEPFPSTGDLPGPS